MKNPNGYGSISKLSGKRRKPWVVRVTVGYNAVGKQIQKNIGTFANRKEAIDCLNLYNLSKENKELAIRIDPVSAKTIQSKAKISHTFAECVEACLERDKDRKSKYWLSGRKVHIKLLNPLMNKNIDEIDLFMIQRVFDNLKAQDRCKSSLNICKIICHEAFEYAVIHKWIDRNEDYTQYIDISSNVKRKIIHKPFTKGEINQLYLDNTFISKIVLCYIYTGCRASELLKVTKYDGYIVCGVKTESGKNRKIPIHSFIKPFFDESITYLSNVNYEKLKREFNKCMKRLNMSHTLHDCRNTFATLGKEYDMKATAIKKIMGHRINDLTDDVYTHESIEYLTREVEKIKGIE